MKFSSKLVLLTLVLFMVGFAGFRPQPSTLYAHWEYNPVAPEPQTLVTGQWNIIRWMHTDGFGGAFYFDPLYSSEVFLVRNTEFKAIGNATMLTSGHCDVTLIYSDGRGNDTILGQVGGESENGVTVVPIEPQTFLNNTAVGAYINLRVKCAQPASMLNADVFVVNQ